MKPFYCLLAFSLSALLASAQSTTRAVKLVGILSYDTVEIVSYDRIVSYDTPLAILEVSKTNNRFGGQGEQFALRAQQSDNGVEIQSIDVTNGTVLAKVGGEPRTLAFDDSGGSKMADKPATIRLQDANLHPLIYFYGDAKGRTVLEHPQVERTGFTFTANPHSKSEAAKAFEELFATRQIAAIPDGDKFVMLVPYAYTNQVTPRSDEFAEPGPVVRPLSINFQGVPLPKALEVYDEYVGRWPRKDPMLPYSGDQSFFIYLVQQNSLSKGQICYAMQTIFTWRGIRAVTNKDNTFGWEKIP